MCRAADLPGRGDSKLLVLTIDRGTYDSSLRLEVELDFKKRLRAIDSCGLFDSMRPANKAYLAEMLRPVEYRRDMPVTKAGGVLDRLLLIQEGGCAVVGQ